MTLAVDTEALWSQIAPTPSTPRAALFVRDAGGAVVAECRRAPDAALIVDEHNAIVSGALTETAPLRALVDEWRAAAADPRRTSLSAQRAITHCADALAALLDASEADR